MRIAYALLIVAAGAAHAADWSVSPLWESPAVLKDPESVVYDADNRRLIVSNMNGKPLEKDGNGFLTTLDLDGRVQVLEWARGLNAPKGLAIVGNRVYVADIDEVVAFDLKDGRMAARYPAPGAKFLNDLTRDARGNVYASDMATNRIHVVSCCVAEVWLDSPDLDNPNGLHVEGNRMYEGAWGVMQPDLSTRVPGRVKVISMTDKSVHDFGGPAPVGNLDGIEVLPDGQVLATDWVAGRLITVSPTGRVRELADLPQGSADIGYDPGRQIVWVPLMRDNKIVAYRLHRR